jgi:hypothetical protein
MKPRRAGTATAIVVGMLGALTATAALAAPAATAGEDDALPRLTTDYDAARTALSPHFDGFRLDEDRRAVDLLDRVWMIIGDWTVSWLEAHPKATAGALTAAIGGLDEELEPEVLPLGGGFLVSTHRGGAGNVFLALPGRDGYRPAWNVKDALRSWSAAAAAAGCDRDADDGDADGDHDEDEDCGCWTSGLGALSPDAAGHPRFYIDATATQYAGTTVGAELTVWRWEGTGAVLELRHGYSYSLDDEAAGPRVEGDEIVLREKKSFRTFYTSGPSLHRRVESRFRLTPSGIENAGEQGLDAELDAIDELLARLLEDQPTDDVASRQAAKLVADQIDWDDARTSRGSPFGMLVDEPPLDPGPTFCVGIDGTGTIRYTFERRDGRAFIARADLRCE